MSRSFLDDLGVAFGTDKSSLLHNYLVEYEKFFPDRENVHWVMEIGVQRGDKKWHARHPVPSLKVWKEFFTNAEIIGVDIKDIDYHEERMAVWIADQSDFMDLEEISRLFTDLDFIIDDGSHKPDDQIHTFEFLKDSLKSGGIYIIEDCNAVAQKAYPEKEQIHAIIRRMKPLLSDWELHWIGSKSAGPKSSLVMKKK